MQYINPLAILELSPQQARDGISSSRLKREKKRLMAEFELNEAPNIELRGIKLGKTQVMELFDQLSDEQSVEYHAKVLENKRLLLFLEESSLDYFYEGDVNLLSAQPEGFLAFIAPYFAFQYNKRLLHAFKQRDWEEIQTLSYTPLAIPNKYSAHAYKDTFHNIHTYIKEIEQTTEEIEGGKAPDGTVQDYCDEMFIASVNRLPEYFSGSRDRYALALENMAISVHNVHQRPKLAIFILQQGLKLELGEDAKGALTHVLNQLKKQEGISGVFDFFGEKDKEKDSAVPWILAAGTGLAAILLYKWIK